MAEVTMNDILALVQTMNEQNRADLLAFARELKAPDPEEAAEKAREKAHKRESKEQVREMVRQQQAAIAARQSMCSHTKENGKTAKSGQVHNDGLFHPFCQRCQKQFTPFAPSGEAIANGVQLV